MKTDQWENLKDLFERATALSGADRQSFLDEISTKDSSLGQQLNYLVEQHEAAGGFLDSGDTTMPVGAFEAGQLVGGRYKVIRQLGRGGMGEVYEVLDTQLKETIALKTVRQDTDLDISIARRLVQELQLARKVTHPNVCRVFDIGWHTEGVEPIVFLTMELLQGETLACRLRRDGPMSPENCLIIARQIASAIDAAHERGIVHRDLKPANIMLTTGDRVVITDFGLARYHVSDQTGSISREGKVIGTPAYMAPEQLSGGRATTASDIYAFGVIVHEIVTGRRPADGPTDHSRPVPSEWRAILEKATRTDPAERFATASEIVQQFQPIVSAPSLHRRWFLIAAGVSAAGVGISLITRTSNRPAVRDESPAAGSRLYLAPLSSGTTDAQLKSVYQLLSLQIEQSPRVSFLDASRVKPRLAQMGKTKDPAVDSKPLDGEPLDSEPVVRELCWLEKTPLVLFTTLTKDRQTFVVTLRLVQLGATPDSIVGTWNQVFTASSDSRLFDLVADATHWTRERIGETKTEVDESDPRPEEATTESWVALTHLFDADRILKEPPKIAGRDSRPAQDPREKAVDLVRLALHTDPNFALAQMRLADIQIMLRKHADGFQSWKRTQELLDANAKAGRRLNQKEELRIRGMLAEDTGDFHTSEAIYSVWSAKYPYDFRPRQFQASSLRFLGRFEAAIEILKKATKDFPDLQFLHSQLAEAELAAGQLEQIPRRLEEMRKLTNNGYAEIIEGKYWCAKNDFAKATASFLKAITGSVQFGTLGYAFLACVQAEQGQYNAAMKSLSDGIESDRKHDHGGEADKQLALAYLNFRLGRQVEARSRIDQALALEKDPDRLRVAGVLYARNGLFSKAEELTKELSDLPPWPIIERFKSRILGEVALAKSQKEIAKRYLDQAAKLEPAYLIRDYFPRYAATFGDLPASISQYQRIIDTKGLFWSYGEREFPGLLTDSLWVMTKYMVSTKHANAKASLQHYCELRRFADDTVPEIGEARRLLERFERDSVFLNQ